MGKTTIGRLAVVSVTTVIVFSFLAWALKVFLILPSAATQTVATLGNNSIWGDAASYLVSIASWFGLFLGNPYAIAFLCFLSVVVLALEMRRGGS